MKIFLSEQQEISTESLELLKVNGHELVTKFSGDKDSSIRGLFIRTYTKVDNKYLDQFPSLSVIMRAGSGLDNIDLNECNSRNIKVFNSPGANAISVAEHALTLMLMLLKNIKGHNSNLMLGRWRERSLLGSELSGKTIGLVGCGAVGLALSKLLQAFDVKILGFTKNPDLNKFESNGIIHSSLDSLLSTSDVVSIQIPLTKETINMIGDKQFSLMKTTCYLINVSRGEIIDEKSLIRALSHNQIMGAAIDVAIGEPNINSRLFTLKNLIITPHIAGYTHEADVVISTQAVKNFLQYMKGIK